MADFALRRRPDMTASSSYYGDAGFMAREDFWAVEVAGCHRCPSVGAQLIASEVDRWRTSRAVRAVDLMGEI
jgi:hypothetical protein